MLVKDFLMSAAQLLDLDSDSGDFSHVVKKNETKLDHRDAKYEGSDTDKRLYTEDDYNIFTAQTYGVKGDMKAQLEREAETRQAFREALDGVKKDLYEPTGAFKAVGVDAPRAITIVPRQMRQAAETRLTKFVNKLRMVDPAKDDEIARLRRSFIDEMQSLDQNAGIDTTQFEVEEGGETKTLNYAAMVKKLLGDLFDQKLAPVLLDPEVREVEDLPLI